MANKIININSQQTTLNKNKVINSPIYLDISMLSKQVNEKNKIDNLKDLKAIFNSLHNIFHWIPGERILNPEFGSNIHSLLYNGITEFNKEQIAAEIQQSISKWEPRVSIVKIVDMTDINDVENNTIRLDIIFTVPSLNNNE
jgi:phage baseplate assembly protein W